MGAIAPVAIPPQLACRRRRMAIMPKQAKAANVIEPGSGTTSFDRA